MEKVMKKLCVCTLSVVIGMLSIQIMPVSAASKTGMGKITNKINKAGYAFLLFQYFDILFLHLL